MRHAQMRAIMDDILLPTARRRCFRFQSQTKRYRLIRTEQTACHSSGRRRLVVDRILLSERNAHMRVGDMETGGGTGVGTGGGGMEMAQGFPPDVVLKIVGFLPPVLALAISERIIPSTHPLIADLRFYMERCPDIATSLAAIYEWDEDRYFEMRCPPSNLRRRSAGTAD
jgi:hypothetical protein